jgi:hypothetical protein
VRSTMFTTCESAEMKMMSSGKRRVLHPETLGFHAIPDEQHPAHGREGRAFHEPARLRRIAFRDLDVQRGADGAIRVEDVQRAVLPEFDRSEGRARVIASRRPTAETRD